MKVIVIDDDRGILEVVKIILTDQGFEVVAVSEGKDAFESIIKNSPDIVLLDLWMSGMDGREITRQLKSQQETQKIPVIILSALNDVEKKAKEAGADGFLAKPFNISDLLTLIKKHSR